MRQLHTGGWNYRFGDGLVKYLQPNATTFWIPIVGLDFDGGAGDGETIR